MKTSIVVVICFFSLLNTYADGGCCLGFKVKITQNDNSEVTGYFYSQCGDFNLDSITADKIIKNWYNAFQNDTLKIYKDVIRLKYPENYGAELITCYPKDIYKIPLKRIKKIEQLEKVDCHPDLSKEYASNGLYPFVIELSKNEIELLKNPPIVSFNYYNCICDFFSLIWVISYNKNLNQEDLIFILNNSLCSAARKDLSSGSNKLCEKEFKNLKEALSKLDVIIFSTTYDK